VSANDFTWRELERELELMTADRDKFRAMALEMVRSEPDQCSDCGADVGDETHVCEADPSLDDEPQPAAGEVPGLRSALTAWVHEHGATLCPNNMPDTFGEGMRAAKRQIWSLLAAYPKSVLCSKPAPAQPPVSKSETTALVLAADGDDASVLMAYGVAFRRLDPVDQDNEGGVLQALSRARVEPVAAWDELREAAEQAHRTADSMNESLRRDVLERLRKALAALGKGGWDE